MKKLILLLTAFLLTIPLVQAQETRIGLKGGVNFSDLSNTKANKDKIRYKLGSHAGAFLYIPMSSPFFAIQPEIIYSRKGYENTGQLVEIRDNQENLLYSAQNGGLVRLNYIDLPVMFTFKSSIIIFEIGPQVSMLVGVRDDSFVQQTFPDGTVVNTPLTRFSRRAVRKIDLGLATGFRLQTENGASMGIRFNQGFL
ncbi:MAG TPA: porin family protein, partial [Adhaeribacter sp.]|nr:porin family protein [Adhaeribacter sp.]